MTTPLNNAFAAAVEQQEITYEYAGRTLTIRRTNYRAGDHFAEMEILEGDSILGYITPYSNEERGAVKAHVFGIVLPRVVPTVEEALKSVVSGQTNGSERDVDYM